MNVDKQVRHTVTFAASQMKTRTCDRETCGLLRPDPSSGSERTFKSKLDCDGLGPETDYPAGTANIVMEASGVVVAPTIDLADRFTIELQQQVLD